MYISGWIIGQLALIPFIFLVGYFYIRLTFTDQFSNFIGCCVMFSLWVIAFMTILMIPYETCTGEIVFSTIEWTIVSLFTTPRFALFTTPSIVLLVDTLRRSVHFRQSKN